MSWIKRGRSETAAVPFDTPGAGILMQLEPLIWNVYLSGEIHTQWRHEIADGIDRRGLPIRLTAPVTDHTASDECGTNLLGAEPAAFWKDSKGAGVNAIRTRTLIHRADVVVVRFGSQYRQWNAAFDAGFAAALGKSLITLHDPDLDHALKEIDAAACATARSPDQVVNTLQYVIEQV